MVPIIDSEAGDFLLNSQLNFFQLQLHLKLVSLHFSKMIAVVSVMMSLAECAITNQ